MSHNKSLGLLAAVGLAGLVVASCGSSNGAASDAGSEITHRPPGPGAIVADSSSGDAGDDAGSGNFDGTTGQTCTTDADCTRDGGPGINKCSNGMLFRFNGVVVTLLPTPICLIPPGASGGNCDPAPPSDPGGMFFHGCDGPDASAPGICIPFSTPAVSGQGHCEFPCNFAFDGSRPTGCPGNDTCTPIPGAVTTDPTGAVNGGLGYCQGSCEKDSDCTLLGTGWVCQKDVGFCTQHPLATRRKALGTACTAADFTSGACYCGIQSNLTQAGFCTSSCIVGGTVPCPNGWLCDNLTSPTSPDGSTTITMENVGTPGVCVPGCTLASDSGSPAESGSPDAGTETDGAVDGATAEAAAPVACPGGSTCQSQTVLGPECLP